MASDCASAVCTAFYVDLDGDGYGAGQATGFCGTAAPVGYANQPGDCCDTATNLALAKLIHPGADFQTTSVGGLCNITWDYDCSGTVESSSTTLLGCTAYPDCKDMRGPFASSNCGTSVGLASCGTSTSNMSSCITSAAGSVLLGCK